MSTINERRWLILIFALYALFALAYSLLMPMWEAPDESAHYLVIRYLARDNEMPTMEQTYEALQPPLYYWLAAQLFRALEAMQPGITRPQRPPLSPPEALTRYDWTAENYRFLWVGQVLRWLNIVVGGGALYFIYRGARQFAKASVDRLGLARSTIPIATIALVGLTPQFLHNSAAISNDPLANLAGAILFYCLGLICSLPLRRWRTILIVAAALAFPFIIKLTVLPMTIAVLAAVFWQARRQWRRRWPWLLGVGLALGVMVIATLLLLTPQRAELLQRAFWWRLTYIRPEILTGWPLWRIVSFYIAAYWGQVAWETVALPGTILGPLMMAAGIGGLASLRLLWPRWPSGRFWLAIAILAVLLAIAWLVAGSLSAWWRVPPGALAGALAALLIVWWRQRQADPALALRLERPALAMVWLAAVLAFLVVFKNFLATPQYQSRFFFPTLGPLSLLMTAGWFSLFPARWVAYLPHLILAVLISLNVLFWSLRIIPIYYQPFLG